jgi:hypothetical protein
MIALTGGLGGLFLLLTALTLWMLQDEEEVYRPGQHVEGLSSELTRTVPDEYPNVTFTDVTEPAGIKFKHFHGTRSTQLPEDMGSGVAWIDYNKDGHLDLFIVNNAGPLTHSQDQRARSPAHCTLYRNDGDGTFTDVSEAAGLDIRVHGMGTAWGDYNNDGWPDLFITTYGVNYLFRNNGDGTFTDISDTAGVGSSEGFWAGAAWGDFNRDGYLDLYVTGYVEYTRTLDGTSTSQYDVETPASLNPSAFPPHRNLLYRNEGDGTFTEIGRRAGVENPEGRGLMATWADFTNDGWPDLYVANDVSDNALYENLGDGTFRNISHSARVADYRGAMGLAVGDWDGDLDLDLFITHWLAQENALYTYLGASSQGPQFMDEADRYGLGQISLDYVGWGTSFLDYDNDGRLDLFVVNGSTLQKPDRPEELVPMPDLLFWNRGKKAGFYEAAEVSGKAVFTTPNGQSLSRPYVGRGAAVGDYDNDGDLDIFIVNHDGPGRLLRNEQAGKDHWLNVQLHGRASNRSAIGTRLRLVADTTAQVREVAAQGSYLSQNSLVQHFGLGTIDRVDTLVVNWPSGHRQTLTEIPVDQTIAVTEETSPSDTEP